MRVIDRLHEGQPGLSQALLQSARTPALRWRPGALLDLGWSEKECRPRAGQPAAAAQVVPVRAAH